MHTGEALATALEILKDNLPSRAASVDVVVAKPVDGDTPENAIERGTRARDRLRQVLEPDLYQKMEDKIAANAQIHLRDDSCGHSCQEEEKQEDEDGELG